LQVLRTCIATVTDCARRDSGGPQSGSVSSPTDELTGRAGPTTQIAMVGSDNIAMAPVDPPPPPPGAASIINIAMAPTEPPQPPSGAP
jgi:hypothetical protein